MLCVCFVYVFLMVCRWFVDIFIVFCTCFEDFSFTLPRGMSGYALVCLDISETSGMSWNVLDFLERILMSGMYCDVSGCLAISEDVCGCLWVCGDVLQCLRISELSADVLGCFEIPWNV